MIDMDLLVILDRSGSMQARKGDHEGGVRSFIEDQRSVAGDVRFTLVQFDTTDPCEIVYDRVPLDLVGTITLIPRGGTPLLDAIGKALAHLEVQQLIERAAQTVVLIVTDGEENSSHEWSKTALTARLAEVAAAGMQTLFLGAGIDAFAEAGGIGIGYSNTLGVVNLPANLNAAYCITSDKVKSARELFRSGASGQAVADSFNYTEQERATVTTGGAGFTPTGTGTMTGGGGGTYMPVPPTPPTTDDTEKE